MAYTNSEAFGNFNLYNVRNELELGRYGREILILGETSGEATEVHSTYLRVLGILGAHGAEAGRSRVIHQRTGEYRRTVQAEHVFLFPLQTLEGATVLYSMGGDRDDYHNGEVWVTYDRKVSRVELGAAMGEVALQYDGLAEPPVLRVIDVQGSNRQGGPESELPAGLVPALSEAAAMRSSGSTS